MKKEKVIKSGKQILIVNVILQKLGNQTPYFSITGEVYGYDKKEMRQKSRMISGGCIHETILKYFPDMHDAVVLHLSDINGIPMHCVENGWYWFGGTKYQKYDRKILAEHLRITETEADEMHDAGLNKEQFTLAVTAMFPRYKAEAEAVITKYEL